MLRRIILFEFYRELIERKFHIVAISSSFTISFPT